MNGKSNFYDAGSYNAYNFNVDFVSLFILLWILSVMKVGNSTFIYCVSSEPFSQRFSHMCVCVCVCVCVCTKTNRNVAIYLNL